ncbi:MAG: hypothetical protein ACW99X_13190 [Candidatus Thorarchaeota archaeon]
MILLKKIPRHSQTMGLIDAFVSAVAENDPTHILSGPDETLETHLMTFAAERSRNEGKTVNL